MSEEHDCGGEAAAYLLGALDRDEADAFAKHMADCIACRDEFATLSVVADALPMAAPQYTLPRGLRRRVMREVRAEPRGALAARRRRWAWPTISLTIPRPAVALGVAVLIAAAVTGGVLAGSGGSSAARVFRASVGDAEVRLSGGHGELIVNRLPAPPPGRIYEVWLKRPGHPPSPTRTLFSVTKSGHGDVGLPGNLHGVNLILVTPEPVGGSQVPTRPAVIVTPI